MQSVRSQPPAEPAGPAATPPADQTYTGARLSACHLKQFMTWKKTKHFTDAFAKCPPSTRPMPRAWFATRPVSARQAVSRMKRPLPTWPEPRARPATVPAASTPGGEAAGQEAHAGRSETSAARSTRCAAERVHALPRHPGPQGTSRLRQGVAVRVIPIWVHRRAIKL